MTAFGSLETAIEAMRQGAYDYLTKPFKLAEVTHAVRRAVDDQRLREENARLRAEVERQFGFERVVGQSRAIKAVLEQVRAVADSDASVLLLGESGTGKELVARALHWSSARRAGPFVPVNCAAVPDTLLESELFGHEKGAFTGADRKRTGLFAAAHGGTLFLDEVGDLSVATQAKLLRAIQDKAVRPVGGSEDIQLDLRLVAATHRDVATLVQEGRFREDLDYRLAVIPIPPCAAARTSSSSPATSRSGAARRNKRIAGFSPEAVTWMREHRWSATRELVW
jgi:DNA-binding NtrC family response regulator